MFLHRALSIARQLTVEMESTSLNLKDHSSRLISSGWLHPAHCLKSVSFFLICPCLSLMVCFASDSFSIVLTSLSVGLGATIEIREFERARGSLQPSVILALTGMSSLEDKRKAFEAGMSG